MFRLMLSGRREFGLGAHTKKRPRANHDNASRRSEMRVRSTLDRTAFKTRAVKSH
jgi:hypothetical protein